MSSLFKNVITFVEVLKQRSPGKPVAKVGLRGDTPSTQSLGLEVLRQGVTLRVVWAQVGLNL